MQKIRVVLLSCLAGIWVMAMQTGCAPVVVGAAAGGGYNTATDQRTLGNQLDDTTLSVKIKTLFIEEKSVPGRKMEVDVIEGHVFLTGVVDTREQAAKAVAIAEQTEGLKKVTSNLQVGIKTMSQSFNDTVLSSKIKAKLMKEPGIRSFNVEVNVDRGEVTLVGLVDSEAHRNRIVEIARTTSGTMKVVDLITVK